MNTIATFILSGFLFALLASCGGSTSGSESSPATVDDSINTRSFYLGFTPWLYEATAAAQNDVYNKIQDNGDIVAHHFIGGIPWQAAYDNSAYPANVEAELNTRLTLTQDNKRIFLAIDSINSARDGLALNWGASTDEPLPAPWNSRNFADPEVIAAYSNFALDLIARFHPVYFNYASEISTLADLNDTRFDQFVVFAQQVYANIKAVYADLPLLVSIDLASPGSTRMQNVAAQFARIADYVDIVGISSYAYAFYSHNEKGNPATLPADWLTQINTIAPGKPVAITETGWPAQNVEIAAFGLNETASDAMQADYLRVLFQQADQLDARFIIWFTIADYDILWNTLLGQDDVARIWRDTGLYDETLQPRPALTMWQQWLARSRR